MTKIIMANSFRGGTGKSTIISNLSSFLASFGFTVMVIDADIISPGIHAIFGIDQGKFDKTLTDYLQGTAKPEDIVYDISKTIEMPDETLFLIPSSIYAGDIATMLREKNNADKLVKALPKLIKLFSPDYILIDTHPGLNREVLAAFSEIDIFLNIVRPDNQDYQGLMITRDIASKFKIKTYVILNKVHKKIRNKELKQSVEKKYGVTVAGMLPLSDDIILSQSSFVFFERNPTHEFSKELEEVGKNVFGVSRREHLDLMKFILEKIKELGPVSLTTLEKQKNVYHHTARWYLKILGEKGFTKKNGDDYTITDKGSEFLKKFSVIRKFVDNFRL